MNGASIPAKLKSEMIEWLKKYLSENGTVSNARIRNEFVERGYDYWLVWDTIDAIDQEGKTIVGVPSVPSDTRGIFFRLAPGATNDTSQ